MFGSLKQKLQSLSPVASPVASPSSSPKPRRKFPFRRTPARLKQRREEFREVQSDPECDFPTAHQQRRKGSAPERKLYLDSFYDGVTGQASGRAAGPATGRRDQQSVTVGRAAGHGQVIHAHTDTTRCQRRMVPVLSDGWCLCCQCELSARWLGGSERAALTPRCSRP